MELPKLKRKAKLRQEFEHYVKEKEFDNRYTIKDKARSYQSLTDQHSSYYFSSSPARKQLKVFKKAISTQPNQGKRTKLTSMINFRIKKIKQIDHKTIKDSSLLDTKSFDFGKIARSSVFSLHTLYQRFNERESLQKFKVNKNKSHFFSGGSQSSEGRAMMETDYLNQLPIQSQLLNHHNPQSLPSKKQSTNMKTQHSKRTEQLRAHVHRNKHLKWLTFLNNRKQQYLDRTKARNQ